jgi:pyruvate formate lyase activating enzyme
VDTAGAVPWEAFEKVMPVTDAFYFDYKSGDDALYRDVIGAERGLVFQNLRRLIERGAQVRVRVPLIPHFNMSDTACTQMCEQLAAAGVTEVDLLPFHRLGSSKYQAMGKTYAYRDTPPSPKEEIDRVAAIYRRYFLNLTIEK